MGTTFITPLDINEGSRATPGLWNRISDTHFTNYSAIESRIDAITSDLSDVMVANVLYTPRESNKGLVFRKTPNPASGTTLGVWAERQGGGVVIGASSNVTYLYVDSNRAIMGGIPSLNSRLILRNQDIEPGSAPAVALGNAGFGIGGKVQGTRPYGALMSDQGDVMTWSGFTVRFLGNRKPATSTSAGSVGDYSFSSQHMYMCTSESSWKRAAISGY
jgi:hypothetical protein